VANPVRRKPDAVTGFTLIELLVVISIVTMLMAILLPALNKARSSANRIHCGSTQRQLGIGYISYTLDFKGRIPIPTTHSANTHYTLYRDVASVKKYTDGSMGLGLLYSKNYVMSPRVFYCTEFRSDSNDTTLQPFKDPKGAVATFMNRFGKTGSSNDVWSTYLMIKVANVQLPGTSGTAGFQDADGLVTDVRIDPNDGYQYISGILDRNIKAPAGRFYPLVTCMQHAQFRRWSHDGKFTNRLAVDGSVRPTNYDFFSTGNAYMYTAWTQMTALQ